MKDVAGMIATAKSLTAYATNCADLPTRASASKLAGYLTLLAYTEEQDTAAATEADIAAEYVKFNERAAAFGMLVAAET